jgi:hypothetical protein
VTLEPSELTLASIAVIFGLALGILIALYLLASRWPRR